MLIDTHSHLYFPEFKDDLEEVLDRCVENDVTTLVAVGVDIETSKVSLRQAQGEFFTERLKGVEVSQQITFYSTIGIHPHNAHEYLDDKKLETDIAELEKIYLSNPDKVIAVGECGLDYMFESNPDFVPTGLTAEQLKKLQKKLFKAQLNLAKKYDLPLIIHCRDDRSKDPDNVDAWNDVLEISGDYFGLLHCYSGKEEITKKALNTRYLFSFAATITYPKNEYLREAVKVVSLDKIALETDCPFLPPQERRGKRNEPTTVVEIARFISELKDTPLKEIEEQTTLNVKRIFNF